MFQDFVQHHVGPAGPQVHDDMHNSALAGTIRMVGSRFQPCGETQRPIFPAPGKLGRGPIEDGEGEKPTPSS